MAIFFTVIGLTECAFIAYDLLSGGSLSSARAPDLGLGIRSWTLHHAMRPGYSSPAVHTNSLGLRSPEVAIPKPSGTFRIVLLGDSFTFGFRAPDDEVFARRLEARLRQEHPDTSIEVVNAGVLSYCPLLEYLQYRNDLSKLEADFVVLNFDMSDVQDHLDYSRDAVWASDGSPLFVTEPSLRRPATVWPDLLSFEWVARHLTGIRRRVQSSVEGSPFALDKERYLWALDNGPELDDAVRRTLEPIEHLTRLLAHQQIPFLLATYPQPWQVSADATPLPPVREQYGIGLHTVHLNDRPFRKLERFATDRRISFLNATGAFRQAAHPASLFLDNDFHFSPLGNQLYADILSRYLTSRVPDPSGR